MPRCAPACNGPSCHRPHRKRKGLTEEEKDLCDLFYAIEAGCKRCVCHLLHERKVGALTPSKTQRYTAVDFAEWTEQHAKESSGELEPLEGALREDLKALLDLGELLQPRAQRAHRREVLQRRPLFRGRQRDQGAEADVAGEAAREVQQGN